MRVQLCPFSRTRSADMTVVSRHQLSSDMQSRARQLIDQVGIVPLAEDRQWMPTICFSISEVALALWWRLQRLPRLGAALGASSYCATTVALLHFMT